LRRLLASPSLDMRSISEELLFSVISFPISHKSTRSNGSVLDANMGTVYIIIFAL
jgi:hypothetical protein